MGRTIALYQEGFGANGWEYYVHGTGREARVLPTTAQTPGSNTTLTNETLMQVGLDYATFYVSDHLGNTRGHIPYLPQQNRPNIGQLLKSGFPCQLYRFSIDLRTFVWARPGAGR